MKANVLASAAALIAISGSACLAADSFESMRLERLHESGGERPMAAPRQRPIRVVRSARPMAEPRQSAAESGGALFSVKEGEDLEGALRDWAKRDGFTVLWRSQYAYEINSDATFSGSLVDAIKGLSYAMKDVRPAPTVDIYLGNHTVVVSNSGASQTD